MLSWGFGQMACRQNSSQNLLRRAEFFDMSIDQYYPKSEAEFTAILSNLSNAESKKEDPAIYSIVIAVKILKNCVNNKPMPLSPDGNIQTFVTHL